MSEWANCWFFWAKRSLAHLIAKIERFAQKTWLGHICNNISSRTWPYLRQYLFPDLRHLYDNISTLTWPDLLQYTVFALTWPYLWHYLYPDMAIFATIYMPWLGHICNNILTLTWPYLWQYLNPYLAIRSAFEIKCDWWNIMKTVACKKKIFSRISPHGYCRSERMFQSASSTAGRRRRTGFWWQDAVPPPLPKVVGRLHRLLGQPDGI